MIQITVANQKGGVGKTTTVLNLGAALALKRGKKLLAVDMDSQANLTDVLYRQEVETSIHDVLIKHEKIDRIITPSRVQGIELVPADISLAKLDRQIMGEVDAYYRLKNTLSLVKKSYDMVLIDAPPALSLATGNSLVASDYLIIPIEPGHFPLKGLKDLLDTISSIQQTANPNLSILGILLTKTERTNVSRDTLEILSQHFGDKMFETTISKSVRIAESPSHHQSVLSYAPNEKSAEQYITLAEEVLARVSR